MTRLNRCKQCSGFMIASASRCPHCDAKGAHRVTRRVRTLLGMVGLGSLSVTLMACYGSPCVQHKEGCVVPPPDDMSAQVDLEPPPTVVDPDGGVLPDVDGGR